jgi:hypothetical protein
MLPWHEREAARPELRADQRDARGQSLDGFQGAARAVHERIQERSIARQMRRDIGNSSEQHDWP